MRITKYTHACVRIEHEGRVLVIDPGTDSEPDVLQGADAVLVTHTHADHWDEKRLEASGLPVHFPGNLTPGETFSAAGFAIKAVGDRHAFIFDKQPDIANFGYIVDDALYHPGDALVVPDQPIETLLVPMQANWLKTAEAIEFLHAVRPERAFGIHDFGLSDYGHLGVAGWLEEDGGFGFRYLAPGEDL